MASAGARAYNGGLGRSPQRGPGQSPWSEGLGGFPQKLKAFLFLDVSYSAVFCSFDWPFLCSSAATRWHLSIWQTIYSGRQMTARERDCGQLRSTRAVLSQGPPRDAPNI